MASKSKWKQQHRLVLPPQEIEARFEQALREGRTQQALELARNLFKQDRSPANMERVQKATLARAQQLRNQGHARDAATLLANSTELGGSDYLRDIAIEIARCGEIRQALSLLDRVTDPDVLKQVMAQAADQSVRQGASGRSLLPESHRAQHDLILEAFRQVEAGQDEAARAALQGIGLQSPFLEWKLFVRGLIAYHQNDDARAQENWQRLDLQRLPARLAAPFRALIDKKYLESQPAAVQQALHAAADRLQGSGMLASLRNVRAALANEQELAQAFRLAETILPAFKQLLPQFVPRLAACFYWAVINHGHPEDKQRYFRVFGAPADDPNLLRLHCLALEQCGNLPDAHQGWQEFDRWLQTATTWGSDELRQRARALIWHRLGQNADKHSGQSDLLPSFLRRRRRKSEFKPPAEQCYRQALALAPDLLDAHEALLDHYRASNKKAKAIKAGEHLLKRHPEHVATLEAVGDLYHESQDFPRSLEYLRRAIQVNPLERRLRHKLSFVQQAQARELALQNRFDEARSAYQAALAIDEAEASTIRAKWASCEFKAGEPERAEELIEQARQASKHPLAVTYLLLVESSRLKLPKAIKDRFTVELALAQAQPPSVEAAIELARIAAAQRRANVEYHGQKTHEKKVLAYLAKALPLEWSEQQLERLCDHVAELRASRMFRQTAQRGRRCYPENPAFWIHEAEAILASKTSYPWRARHFLKRAQELTHALPPGDRQTRLLEEIHGLQDCVPAELPMGFPPLQFFEQMFDSFEGDDTEDEDEDPSWR